MQLYFIRHAQSANNALWADTASSKGRSEDPELTDLGRKQAQALANFLLKGDPRGGNACNGSQPGGFHFTHLYASYMLRAVQTGTVVAQRLGMPLHGWEELHEHGGIYLEDEAAGTLQYLPGKDQAYFQVHYPEFILPENFTKEGWWYRRAVESEEQCAARAGVFLQALLEKHGGTENRVAVISHGDFYNFLLQEIMDFRPVKPVWFTIFNTAITRINFEVEGTELMYQNRVDHLTNDLIT